MATVSFDHTNYLFLMKRERERASKQKKTENNNDSLDSLPNSLLLYDVEYFLLGYTDFALASQTQNNKYTIAHRPKVDQDSLHNKYLKDENGTACK